MSKAIMKYSAARNHKRKTGAARKEATVSPQAESLKVPPTLTMHQRPTCQPQTDERPTLRTRDGRVLATVEAWRPDLAVN